MAESRFTQEQIERARACKSPEELQLLITSEGVQLTDDELDMVAGGASYSEREEKSYKYVCRSCGADCTYQGPQKRYVCTGCGRSKMYPSDMNTVEC